MAKATMTMPSGTTVVIEGSEGEIETILRRIDKAPEKSRARTTERSKGRKGESEKALGDYVLELREAGLFEKPQGLADIKNALQAEGHIVPITTLSGVMLRRVKNRELRRFKEEKTWKYVKR